MPQQVKYCPRTACAPFRGNDFIHELRLLYINLSTTCISAEPPHAVHSHRSNNGTAVCPAELARKKGWSCKALHLDFTSRDVFETIHIDAASTGVVFMHDGYVCLCHACMQLWNTCHCMAYGFQGTVHILIADALDLGYILYMRCT